MKNRCILFVLCILFLSGCFGQNEKQESPIIEGNAAIEENTKEDIIVEEETENLIGTEQSVTWQEAYNTYIQEGLDLCLEGMSTSIKESSDEYIPLDNFKVNAIDLNADSVPELIIDDAYNSIWVFAFDSSSGEVYCVCERICRASLFSGEGSFTCGESPTGGMYYYQKYDMAHGKFVAGSTCSSDQCDPSTGIFLDAPVFTASEYGENLDEETYQMAQQEMNIYRENGVDWWSDSTRITETFF